MPDSRAEAAAALAVAVLLERRRRLGWRRANGGVIPGVSGGACLFDREGSHPNGSCFGPHPPGSRYSPADDSGVGAGSHVDSIDRIGWFWRRANCGGGGRAVRGRSRRRGGGGGDAVTARSERVGSGDAAGDAGSESGRRSSGRTGGGGPTRQWSGAGLLAQWGLASAAGGAEACRAAASSTGRSGGGQARRCSNAPGARPRAGTSGPPRAEQGGRRRERDREAAGAMAARERRRGGRRRDGAASPTAAPSLESSVGVPFLWEEAPGRPKAVVAVPRPHDVVGGVATPSCAPAADDERAPVSHGGDSDKARTSGEDGDWDASEGGRRALGERGVEEVGERSEREEAGVAPRRVLLLVELAVVPTTSSPPLPLPPSPWPSSPSRRPAPLLLSFRCRRTGRLSPPLRRQPPLSSSLSLAASLLLSRRRCARSTANDLTSPLPPCPLEGTRREEKRKREKKERNVGPTPFSITYMPSLPPSLGLAVEDGLVDATQPSASCIFSPTSAPSTDAVFSTRGLPISAMFCGLGGAGVYSSFTSGRFDAGLQLPTGRCAPGSELPGAGFVSSRLHAGLLLPSRCCAPRSELLGADLTSAVRVTS
uniref:Uncharacterized protein n=1 Tax=Oryza sativa subsp. japonica TaxID=39947 RepID=Q6YX66_ORYSJ|nr:hypothetical protein [Oryza sativa Japonica Group]